MLLGLVITSWMLIKIRLEENKKWQKNQFFTSQVGGNISDYQLPSSSSTTAKNTYG
jgi:hypothetical protein